MQKIVSILLALLLCLSSALALGEEIDLSKQEPYHAVMVYVCAGDMPDQAEVEKELNKLTVAALNTTVELMPMTISSWMSQIQLLLVGGDQIDIAPIQSNNAASYVDAGLLSDLTESMYIHGKDILATFGEKDVRCCMVGDFLWGTPVNKERAHPMAFCMRTDMLEAAGIDPSTIQSVDDMTAVYEKVQALYPDMIMFNGTAGFAPAYLTYGIDYLGDKFGVLEDYGRTTTVTNYYESDLYKHYVEIARDWYLKGYTSEDMATSTDSGENLVRAGNTFSFCCPGKPNTEQEKDDMCGYDMTVVFVDEPSMSTSNTTGTCYTIPTNAGDPDRALQLLNFIVASQEAEDLLNWGIEGKHWVVTEDGTIDYPEGITSENVGYHMNYGWAMPNQFKAHVWKGNAPDVWESYEKMKAESIVSYAYGFVPDLSNVANEIAALNSVTAEYVNLLACGVVDVEQGLKDFNAKLYDAGLQKVIDLKQQQLNEWLEKNGK